jgi:hypothetical protein
MAITDKLLSADGHLETLFEAPEGAIDALFESHVAAGVTTAYTFTGTDGADWNPLWTFTQGTGDVLTNRGRMVTGTGAFSGVSAYIDTGQSDGTVRIDVEIPTNDAQFPEVRFRFDPGNYDYLRILLEPHNDVVRLHSYDNDVQQSLLDSETFAIAANDVVHIKMVGSGNEVRVRLWLNSDSEPSTYQLIGSSSLGASNTDLMVRTVTSNAGIAITNYWDNLSITSAGIDTATGTIALTDANDTSAITGTAINTSVTGTIAVTDAADTSSITGTETFSGTIAVTDAADTSAITGTETFSGTIAVTDANDTSSITGTPASSPTGTIAVTDANDTAAFSGTSVNPSVTGTITVTEANDTSSITASQQFPGTITVTEQADVAAVAGVVANPVTGSVSITEAVDAMAFSGTVANPVTGTITIIEQPDRVFIQAQRFGKEPDAQRRPTIIFRGRSNRMYYDPNKNPVTGPSGNP